MAQLGKRSWSSTYRADGAMTATEQEQFFQAFHDALIAVGLVQTSDTGQLASFAGLPISSSLNHGYRIYRFDDDLQVSAPIFIRVSFLLAYINSFASFSYLDFSAGKGTNGAGALAEATPGMTSATFVTNNPSSSQIPNRATASYVSAGPGYLWLVLHANSVFGQQRLPTTSYPGRPEPIDHPLVFFAICRSADHAGQPTEEGFSALSGKNLVGYTRDRLLCYSVGSDGVSRLTEGAFSVPWLEDAQSQGGKAAVGRGYGWYANGAQELNPLFAFAAIGNQALSQADTVEMAVYGTTPRTYILPDPGCGPMNRVLYNQYIRTAFLGLWEGPTV